MRNRILPMTCLVIWCLASGAILTSKHILGVVTTMLFLAVVLVVALIAAIRRERRRDGHFSDHNFVAGVILTVATMLILMSLPGHLGKLIWLIAIILGIISLMRWSIDGVKPSGLYTRLVEFFEDQEVQRAAKKRRKQAAKAPSSFDELSIGQQPNRVEPQLHPVS